MVFEGELRKRASRMSKVGQVRMETPWLGFTVMDVLSTKDLVLLGFRIMLQ